MTNKIYKIQAPKQTIPRTEEPISQLQQLERLFSELAPRDGRGNAPSEGGESAVLESEDLLEELNSVKETLKREMAISKGLRRTIEKLQEESKRLGKTTEHEMVDGIGIRTDEKLELEDQTKTRGEGRKVKQSDILELREKVHELEKENESLQHKLKKKEKALERFQSEETGNRKIFYCLYIIHIGSSQNGNSLFKY